MDIYRVRHHFAVKELRRGVIQNEKRPTFHGWPTIANMGGDKLVAVASGNRQAHICPFGRVFLYESDDHGLTWTGPCVLSHGPLDDRDAGVCVSAHGTWLVNYFTSSYFAYLEDAPREWQALSRKITIDTLKKEHGFWLLRSTDQGKSWSGKYRVPVNNVHGPIVLADGTLFWQGKGFRDLAGASTFADDLVSVISTDDGLTWQEVGRIGLFDYPGLDIRNFHELSSVQAADGTIVTHVRVHSYPWGTWQMRSPDQGRTWSRPEPMLNPTLGYPAHLLRLHDGRLISSYGYRADVSGIRVRVSEDHGNSWSEELVLLDGSPTSELGYPSTAQFAGGTLFTLWYQADPKTQIASLHYLHWELVD